ncbi:unnamed protein product [Parajaminaea phylloscopi]
MAAAKGKQAPPWIDPSLRLWAVDVSAWKAEDSDKDRLAGLTKQLFGGRHEDVERVTKYVRAIDRTRSLAAMLLPRVALVTQSAEVGSDRPIPWSELVFDRTKEGRPFLTHPKLPTPIDFNISHDSDWVVLAFRVQPDDGGPSTSLPPPGIRLGVDVMALSLPHFEQSASTFLETMSESVTPAEHDWVQSATRSTADQTESLQRLYDLWTYKEALTKNLGLGLGFDFKRVQVGLWECESEGEGRDAAENRRTRRSGSRGILQVDGKVDARYTFTEVLLPAGSCNADERHRAAGSQAVVCQGPLLATAEHDVTVQQVSPALVADEAVRCGLLRIWTMRELVTEAERLHQTIP